MATTIRLQRVVGIWLGEGEAAQRITDRYRLMCFSGLEYRADSMCAHLADGPDSRPLAAIGLTGGYIRLEFSPTLGEVLAVSEFGSPRALSAEELALPKAYTIGQWCDGMGSNFSQSFATATRVNLDLMVWNDDEIEIEQREI